VWVVGGGRQTESGMLASNEVRDRTQPASSLICEAISLPQDLLRGARRLARTVRVGDEAQLFFRRCLILEEWTNKIQKAI
jgi:hypothetical protein